LALELGGMTVGELSRRMSSAEETYWIARHELEPLPTPQIIMHLAQIAQYIQNVNAKKQDRGKLTDFMLFFKKKTNVQENVDQNIRAMFGINKDK
jgi:hypothetical protein